MSEQSNFTTKKINGKQVEWDKQLRGIPRKFKLINDDVVAKESPKQAEPLKASRKKDVETDPVT